MVAYRVPRQDVAVGAEIAPAWRSHERLVTSGGVGARSEAVCRLMATVILLGCLLAYALAS